MSVVAIAKPIRMRFVIVVIVTGASAGVGVVVRIVVLIADTWTAFVPFLAMEIARRSVRFAKKFILMFMRVAPVGFVQPIVLSVRVVAHV